MKFRFTVRDLFWLTAVVALVLGWWLDHIPHSVLAKNYYPDHLELQASQEAMCHFQEEHYAMIKWYERELAELNTSHASR